jgi:hypothetical protein
VFLVQMRSAIDQAQLEARSELLSEEKCEEEGQAASAAKQHSVDPKELNGGVLALQASVPRTFARDATGGGGAGAGAGAGAMPAGAMPVVTTVAPDFSSSELLQRYVEEGNAVVQPCEEEGTAGEKAGRGKNKGGGRGKGKSGGRGKASVRVPSPINDSSTRK